MIIDASLQNLFIQMPLKIFLKDLNLELCSGNKPFLDSIGCKTDKEIYRLTDFDMPWRSFANYYRKIDKHVLAKKIPYKGIEPHMLQNGKLIKVFVTKIPITNTKGNIVGICCYYDEISPQPLETKLPKRQAECLGYLITGLSNKVIAERMNIKVRTVEYYIEILKNKFNCENRTQLICNLGNQIADVS